MTLNLKLLEAMKLEMNTVAETVEVWLREVDIWDFKEACIEERLSTINT